MVYMYLKYITCFSIKTENKMKIIRQITNNLSISCFFGITLFFFQLFGDNIIGGMIVQDQCRHYE